MQLIFFSKMLNQIQNWILRELVLLWVLMVLVVSLYTIDSTHGSLALKAYQQNLYLEYYY